MSLKAQLVQSAPAYTEAVNHPFLQAAGNGTIDKCPFGLWPSQDRIYAGYAYPKLLGALIAAIPFNKSHQAESESANRGISTTPTACLDYLVKQGDFFGTFDLDMWKERKGTRDYIAEMDSVGNSKNIEEGLIFLWAMEKVGLLVSCSLPALERPFQKSPTESLVMQFVENWSSPEFVKFVDELAALANATKVPAERAKENWDRVIELEKDFWPVAGEEIRMKKEGL
ncbi:heme oxygenase-like protein [Mycena olivaceomarginata]|nr:heme oxygenase-like protein [Mycena olivaceomarginata]